uniref:Si:ch211-207n2.7 n=1 Tax=Seriola dumerili TaxID=41447 RepID=A0A3B4UW31_SERDU
MSVPLCSSGRGRRGWCTSVMNSLSSNHALKPLVPTLCLVVVVIYGLADKLRNFVSGIFIPQYHYPYAVALCFAQVGACSPLVSMDGLLFDQNQFHPEAGIAATYPHLCSDFHREWDIYLVKTMVCHLRTNSPLMNFLCISAASKGLSGIEPLEYIYAPLALILHSLSLTWLAKVSDAERCHSPDAQASIFDIYYTQLVNQSWVLGLLWLLHPDSPWQVLSQGSWQSLLFHGYLLAILLLGVALNFLVGISALCVSPLSAALLHSARQAVQPFFQLL